MQLYFKSYYRRLYYCFSIFLFLVFLIGCQNAPKTKHVFLFVGDGMGLAQVAATEGYQKAVLNRGGVESASLCFTRFPIQALVNTNPADCHITDSAAAGTAMATGKKTSCGRISMSPDGTTPYPTIAELAHKAGMKTGIITTVPLTHATPAAFYAHVLHRKDFSEITRQMVDSDIDFFGGGGISTSKHQKKRNSPDSPSIDFHRDAVANGYHFNDISASLRNETAVAGKAIAIVNNLSSDNSMPYAIDRNNDTPTLAEITRLGIMQLSNNKGGFFVMVEGGKIDWAAHDNDVATMIHEVMAFNDAVGQALAFYSRHPKNTLIIVTADHETGGLSLGNGREKNLGYHLIDMQPASYERLEASFSEMVATNNGPLSIKDISQWMGDHFGKGFSDRLSEADYGIIGDALQQYIGDRSDAESKPQKGLYSKVNPVVKTVVHLLNDKAGFAWGSSDHTAIPVPLFAIGAGSEKFAGCYENTAIFKKIASQLQ